MFKIISKIIFLFILGVLIATPALSATNILFSTLSVTAEKGESFDVEIRLDPIGEKSYTSLIELKFPADLLELTSFTYASGWITISQPGYDMIDNKAGVMVKTAGYPRGFSAKQVFGRASFKAKKNGRGAIRVGANSITLDANNQDTLLRPFPSIAVSIQGAEVVAAEVVAAEEAAEAVRAITIIENVITQLPGKEGVPPMYTGQASIPGALLQFIVDDGLIVDRLFADETGAWKWTVPEDLPPGVHKLTVTALNPLNPDVSTTSVRGFELFFYEPALFDVEIGPSGELFQKRNIIFVIAIVVVVGIFLVGALFLLFAYKKNKKNKKRKRGENNAH